VNNKIKELAEEAGFIPGVMGLNRFTYFDPEKFAELIIQECIAAHQDDYGVDIIGDVLKEHFGITQ
jgi:hypothetical protein